MQTTFVARNKYYVLVHVCVMTYLELGLLHLHVHVMTYVELGLLHVNICDSHYNLIIYS